MTFWEWFFLFLIYIPLLMMWGVALVDIFMRQDLSGGTKALWVIGLFVFPWVGLLVYLLTRPSTVPGALTSAPVEAPTSSLAGELEQLAKLRSQGVISEAEYAAAKAKLIETTEPYAKAA
jgi:hypothetical protein